MSAGKSVYQNGGFGLMPSITSTEAGEGDKENGTNDETLGCMNIEGPASKLTDYAAQNVGLAQRSIPK